MQAGRWQQVRQLFETVCDLDASRRADVLARSCGDDAALRAEVESLLSWSDTPTPLETPAADAFPELFAETDATLIGQRLGAYRAGVSSLGTLRRYPVLNWS